MNWEILLAGAIPAALSLVGVIYSRSVERRTAERAAQVAERVAEVDEKARAAETASIEVETLTSIISTLRSEMARSRETLSNEINELRLDMERCDQDRRKLQIVVEDLRRRLGL